MINTLLSTPRALFSIPNKMIRGNHIDLIYHMYVHFKCLVECVYNSECWVKSRGKQFFLTVLRGLLANKGRLQQVLKLISVISAGAYYIPIK